jgi:spermidine synthase
MIGLMQAIPQGGEPQTFAMRSYFLFFLISGFCSLVYEVVWLRLSMASFGVTAGFIAILLSAFMAGLGIGSWGAGVLARRITVPKVGLRLYATAECCIGVSAFAVPYLLQLGRFLLQNLGSAAAWQSFGYYVLSGFWITLTLVPWCICMGGTFPLLMSVIRATAASESERSFSYLYAANVLGALLGTVLSAFLLIELLGFKGTLYLTGALNFTIAAFATRISRTLPKQHSVTLVSKPSSSQLLYGLPGKSVLWMLFTTGFVSMGLEVIWVRQFTPYLGNVVYAFAGILAVYLFSTFTGSNDYRSWIRSHDASESAKSWTLLALFAVIPIVAADPLLPFRIGPVQLSGLRLASIVLFCGYAGFLTPLLVESWSSGFADRAGTAYAFNILGAILGPLFAGFILLPQLSERWASALLACPLFFIAGSIAIRFNSKLRFAVCTLAGLLLVVTAHDYENLYAKREVWRDSTATVIAAGQGLGRKLLVNGIGMTSLTPITKYMAHLPLAFMPRKPQNALVICFGMGTTFRSALSWGIETTVVDLVPSVPKTFQYFHDDAANVLAVPLARVVVDDGRRFLDGSQERYDVIIVDPPPPPHAPGSSLLYSEEFYGIVKRHLTDDGILQMWLPEFDTDPGTTASVTKTIRESFSYVRGFRSLNAYGIHFLAGSKPLPLTSSSILSNRLPHLAAKDFVEWGPKASQEEQFQEVLSQEVSLDDLVSEDMRAPVLRDDQPFNEYYLLRNMFLTHRR